MNQKLVVSIKTNKNTVYQLTYELYATHLTNKWIDITQKNLKNTNCKIHSSFNNKTFDQIDEIYARLKELTILINNEYSKKLPVYDTFDNKRLNELHEEFEVFGELLKPSNSSITKTAINKVKVSPTLTAHFFELNDKIHLCEDTISSKNNIWPSMGLLYDLHPLGLHCPIDEKDKMFLTPNFQWGGLYLGYNTLGKDWQNVCKDNDIEVIERDMVKIQERFAAETWMNFGQSTKFIDRVNHFYKWVDNLPPHVKQKVPLDNLNKIALGRYPLGQLEINSTLLDFNPNKQDWDTFNHPCKLEWNKKVLTTFKEVVKIEFVNVPNQPN